MGEILGGARLPNVDIGIPKRLLILAETIVRP
jgi:hypothetical protein